VPAAKDEANVLGVLITALGPLSPESRKRLLHTVATFYDVEALERSDASVAVERARSPHVAPAKNVFSADRTESAKDFVHEKDPKSETERLVCLAYYLTHYRGQNHFKTIDLTQLNTEAAQVKFSNASATVHNASKQGLIGPAPGGNKQITARGERFVSFLPDRSAALAVLSTRNSKRKRNSGGESD
jgi:hypothetical protein